VLALRCWEEGWFTEINYKGDKIRPVLISYAHPKVHDVEHEKCRALG
jgi:hypothetical protein